jgi:hypothetical protein
MKTAQQKAVELVDDANVEFGIDFDQVSPLIKAIVKLLKEQDRDTRHACAEAVSGLHEVCETPNGGIAICPSDAHDACMNVKAV